MINLALGQLFGYGFLKTRLFNVGESLGVHDLLRLAVSILK